MGDGEDGVRLGGDGLLLEWSGCRLRANLRIQGIDDVYSHKGGKNVYHLGCSVFACLCPSSILSAHGLLCLVSCCPIHKCDPIRENKTERNTHLPIPIIHTQSITGRPLRNPIRKNLSLYPFGGKEATNGCYFHSAS